VVLDLDWADYWTLKTEADRRGMTLSNYVRIQCELPEERQGVKRTRDALEKGKKPKQ
jgi:hypothetical protein